LKLSPANSHPILEGNRSDAASSIAEAPPRSQYRKNLPARYYLDHFNEFLSVIRSRYSHTLTENHWKFLTDFSTLSSDAQCLFVRMLNRQGELFDTRKLNYAEIEDIPAQLVVLRQNGFIRRLEQQDADQWLCEVKRAELLSLISTQCASGSFGRSWSKKALLDFARIHLDTKHYSVLDMMSLFVVQQRKAEVGYFLFLYFGKFEQSLGKFTLRDLGVMRTGSFKKNFKPRFETQEDALSSWFYAQRLRDLEQLQLDGCQREGRLISEWLKPVGDQSVLMRSQLLFRLGEKLEKFGDTDLAIEVYSHSESWPATERLARLIYKKGEKKQAEQALVKMIDDPSCDDELLFARDFFERKYKKKRTSRITDILRDAQILKVDESFRDAPERGAAVYYRDNGAKVFFAENRIWKSLFGLVFWSLLFENYDTGLHNDFEKRPSDLDDGRFYKNFSKEIEKTLADFIESDRFVTTLIETATRVYGTANGIFRWRSTMLEEIQCLIASTQKKGIAEILRRMAKDYANNHSGFPDLMVIRNDKSCFIEIKAEGDQLRRNQLKQIVAMEDAGLSVEVNRLEWVCDPNRLYVVVDIETTGSRSGSNRITEIAAVKMRGNVVIDEWQSLIQPARSIPINITKLTGITNQMVADAPLFQEIAESFERFTEDCVFVAHNVRFDYGFICDEYRRIEQSYRRPTLCTCVEMRKWYGGLRSYSLANLCSEYEIPLTSHHRAMCDAKAAGELLLMVNEKRLGLLAGSLSNHSLC